jgi:tetratricopeptide (TPR) repeat protein
LVQRALEAYLDQHYEDSIDLFQKALDVDKKNEAARQGLKSALRKQKELIEKQQEMERPAFHFAELYMGRGEWVEAMDRLKGILRRQPDHPKATMLAKKIRKKVENQFDKAVPSSNEWFYLKGVMAYLNGDWFQAAQLWEQVYAFNPDQVSLVGHISRAKQNLDDKQRLERIALCQNIAWDNLQKGEYEEAIKAWRELLTIDANNSVAREGIQQAQEAAAKDLVRKRQEEVQKMSQQAMDAYIEREYKKSLDLWAKVLDYDPDNTLAKDYVKRIQNRGQAASYSYAPSVGGGSSYFANSSSYGAADTSGYQKAMGLAKEEKYAEAVEYLERYVQKYPNEYRAQSALDEIKRKQKDLADKYYKDGLASYSQGVSADAIKQWQAALRIDPDYQRARQALIKAMAEAKRQ